MGADARPGPHPGPDRGRRLAEDRRCPRSERYGHERRFLHHRRHPVRPGGDGGRGGPREHLRGPDQGRPAPDFGHGRQDLHQDRRGLLLEAGRGQDRPAGGGPGRFRRRFPLHHGNDHQGRRQQHLLHGAVHG